MRKKLLSVLIMLMAMCIFFAIVSCDNSNDDKTNSDLESGDIQIPPSGDNTDKDGEEGDGQNHEHTHSFDTTWTKDATYHWLASTCEHDIIKDKAEHIWDSGEITVFATCSKTGIKKYTCSVCNATKEEILPIVDEHVFSAEYSYDDTYHWHDSTCQHTVNKDKNNHGFNIDGVCSECEYFKYEGMKFQLNADNKSYMLKSVGSVKDSEIQIPSTYKGLPVTGIGYRAFVNCQTLTSVTIPSSIKNIGEAAFFACTNLTRVEISDGVEIVDHDAFWMCEKLTAIRIPYTVKSINASAFNYCSALESVTVDEANTKYKSDGNCVIESNSKVVFGCKTSVIPAYVTGIGEFAFRGLLTLTDIRIPDNIVIIDGWAFSGCSNLLSVEISSELKNIGEFAFYECKNLKDITIPSKVESIDTNAFADCDNLTSVQFENTRNWYISETDATGTIIDVTNPSTNAVNLVTTYKDYYWKFHSAIA